MNASTWKSRPEGTLRASFGIVIWLLSTVAAAVTAGSYANDGRSQLCWVVLGFLALCLLSVVIFRGPKDQEPIWIVSACIEAMRWQLLVASVIGAIGLAVVIEKHGQPVREALGVNFGTAWLLLMLTALGAGIGTVLTRSYAVAADAREERESREALASAVALAVREYDEEQRGAAAEAIGLEVAKAIGHGKASRTTFWDRFFGR